MVEVQVGAPATIPKRCVEVSEGETPTATHEIMLVVSVDVQVVVTVSQGTVPAYKGPITYEGREHEGTLLVMY